MPDDKHHRMFVPFGHNISLLAGAPAVMVLFESFGLVLLRLQRILVLLYGLRPLL
jgi:hypothetical protein